MTCALLLQVVGVVACCIGAATDLHSGRIPNWLTLPLIPAAVACQLLSRGAWGFTESLAGLVLCAGVPWAVFKTSGGRAIGGGDVKLFGALGALLGPTTGLEIELGALSLLLVFALVRLAFVGELWRALASTGRLLTAPLRKGRAEAAPVALTEMRLGPAIALAALVSVASRHVVLGSPWLV